jgi:uncharacterized protein
VDDLREAYEAFAQGNFDPFVNLLSPNVQWHLPGRSRYAGTTTSRDALFARMLRQYEESDGTTSLEWVNGIESGPLVAVAERLRATRGERRMELDVVVVYRFEGQQVVEAWDIFGDQDLYDDFWGA